MYLLNIELYNGYINCQLNDAIKNILGNKFIQDI